MKAEEKYAIFCDSESGLQLSNEHSSELWDALFSLVQILSEGSSSARQKEPSATLEILFAWKKSPRYVASARELYSWRGCLDEIKNADLQAKCSKSILDKQVLVLVTDKPAMLKIAGEITNSLLHSYSLKHEFTFEPSSV